MRIGSLSSLAVGMTLLALAGCGFGENIPPEEVIKRSIIHSHTVDSVTLALSADIRTEQSGAFSGSVVVQGAVRSGGQAWSADTSFNVESTLRRGHERASGRVVVVSPGDGRVYLRPESMEGMLGDLVMRSLTGSVNGWWMTGTGETVGTSGRRAPDPDLFGGYSKAITVVEDLGIERNGNGVRQYHYRVALRPEELSGIPGGSAEPSAISGNGELWINTKDFSLGRALWNLSSVPTPFGLAAINADIVFSEYNRAPFIQAPAGSSSLLPLESIFAIFSS